MNRFFLRRHPCAGHDDTYWYEIIENVNAFPLAVSTERQVAVVESETQGGKLIDALNAQRRAGIIEGMTRFAWWADGVEMVGTCGTTLKQAIEDLDKERI